MRRTRITRRSPRPRHCGPRLVSHNRTGTGRRPIEHQLTTLRFAIVGPGRLGSSLALALMDRGATLAGYSTNTSAGRKRAMELLGGAHCPDLATLVDLRPDLYVLSVPDAAVPKVAQELASLLAQAHLQASGTSSDTPRPVVAHTSGGTSLRTLSPCLEAGVDVLVFHPLQTFSDPESGRHRFQDVPVAITADSAEDVSQTRSFGFSLAELLGARPFYLEDHNRSLYHAAAAMACNHFVTLEHAAQEMFIAAGLPADSALSYFLPLVETTLANISAQGTAAALTGPVSRGDAQTVALHLSAISERVPHLIPLYRSLALATLELVRLRADLDQAAMDSLTGLLTAPSGKDGYRLPTGSDLLREPNHPTDKKEGKY